MPKQKSAIRICKSIEPKGTLKTVTVSKDPDGKYYASFMFDVGEAEPLPQTENMIGLDMGVETFCITSDGEKHKLPEMSKKEAKITREQKKLSRKVKGSKNRNKQRIKLARAHKAASNTRKDFQHKLSKKITDENQVIVVEDLAAKNLLKNHKLAKAISRQGWRQFIAMLEYKSARKGRTLIKIDRFFPSSQICSACGDRGSKKTLDVREWVCPVCGAAHDRDINAAVNILTAGTVGIAC
jgi:putative transposase